MPIRPARVTGAVAFATPTETLTADAVAAEIGRYGQKIHPATRTFQALRIAVNHETEILEQFIVDSIDRIRRQDITHDLARESGFESVGALLKIAKHGRGQNIYLIRFHYLAPGAWYY